VASEDYDIGDRIEFTATFKNSVGALANPSSVTFVLTLPTGAKVTLSPVTNPSVGVYRAEHLATMEGLHHLRATGAGGVDAVEQLAVYVRP
jgi:hypothetical protein